MISVILYGRNDAHGYNLHRRAALSLNCLADVLTEPDDEVIFVDYNTPDELPTFIEAISDTLTERCLARLRVLRVPATIHDQRFAPRTHLPVAEPVARNVAARRSNPANRWLLSTNTDMIFVPLRARSMSEICRDLPDGFYGLPRFELPEWLWERLPRSDPHRALADIERLGPALRLDEPTVSHEWIRFDAPGDCQLILREDFAAIDGFDENMLLGYHVDSNLSRRLMLHRGSIESLEDHLAGYHCNHNRTRTVYHGRGVENDLQRFFYSVDDAAVPAQRTSWGLAGITMHEVPLRNCISADSAAALVDAIPTRPRSTSDAMEAPFLISYDSGHILPFVADTLFISSRDTTVGYLGANTVLEGMLAATVDGLGFARSLVSARFDDSAAIDELDEKADTFIIDLGVDVSEESSFLHDLSRREFGRIPPGVMDALPVLYRLFDRERKRYEKTKHLRPIVLVNSSAVFWEAAILAQLDCSYTTVHSRVRRATVKPVLDEDIAAIQREFERSRRLMRWSARRESGADALRIHPGERLDLGQLRNYGGFGTGWAPPEDDGLWTLGPRSELRIAVDEVTDRDYVLTLSIRMVCIGSGESLRVDLLLNDEHVAARDFTDPEAGARWRVHFPSSALAGGGFRLTLLIAEPHTPLALGWSTDDRPLGIQISGLALHEADWSVRLGQTLVGADAEPLLGNGWGALESTGVWTIGDQAELAFRLSDAAPRGVDLVFDALPFVTANHPKLEVEAWVRGQRVTAQAFRYDADAQPFRVHVPRALLDANCQVTLVLLLRHPARPADVGLSTDPRRLGLHLRSVTISAPMTVLAVEHPALRRIRRRLRRSLRA
jgi:hypothetical protein